MHGSPAWIFQIRWIGTTTWIVHHFYQLTKNWATQINIKMLSKKTFPHRGWKCIPIKSKISQKLSLFWQLGHFFTPVVAVKSNFVSYISGNEPPSLHITINGIFQIILHLVLIVGVIEYGMTGVFIYLQ